MTDYRNVQYLQSLYRMAWLQFCEWRQVWPQPFSTVFCCRSDRPTFLFPQAFKCCHRLISCMYVWIWFRFCADSKWLYSQFNTADQQPRFSALILMLANIQTLSIHGKTSPFDLILRAFHKRVQTGLEVFHNLWRVARCFIAPMQMLRHFLVTRGRDRGTCRLSRFFWLKYSF